MALNLVSLVMQFLTPDMIGRIASALGLDRNTTQSAVGAAVPGMLAGFSSLAAQPDGAQRLADAVRGQSGSLSSFASNLGGQGQSSLIERGTNMLSSLLGSRDETALASAVGSYANVNRGTSDSLLGMLAPVIMGTIAQQQGPRDLDGRGISGLLASQRDSIADAMPSGFGNLLSGTGLLSGLGGAARSAASQTGRAASSAAYAVSDAGRGAMREAERSTSGWLWVIPLAILAALALWWLSQRAPSSVIPNFGTTQNLTVGSVNVGNLVSDSMGGLRSALTGVTDVASAQSALPKLQQLGSQFDRIAELKGQMSAAQQSTLAGMINPGMQAINQQSNRVLGIPGVSEVLGPTVNSLVMKLSGLAS